MKKNSEQMIILFLLALNSFYLINDIRDDLASNESGLHIFIELLTAALTLLFLMKTFSQVRFLRLEKTALTAQLGAAQKESQDWKLKNSELLQGLSKAIDDQLQKWNLSLAEKEVALLMLKGLSHKEIAALRDTTEQTVKQQGSSIYRKSGLSGRAEFLAFFLEDLFSGISLNSNESS